MGTWETTVNEEQHRCERPRDEALDGKHVGSIWRCDCGMRWEIVGEARDGAAAWLGKANLDDRA